MNRNAITNPDTRILKTEYRNYDLLARFWNGEYRGRIWKNSRRVADYNGDNLDLILESLIDIVDRQIDEKSLSWVGALPGAADYWDAWLSIMHKLTESEKRLLAITTNADFYASTLEALQMQTKYISFASITKAFEKIAMRLCDELAFYPKENIDSEYLLVLLEAESVPLINKADHVIKLKQIAANTFVDVLEQYNDMASTG